MASCLAVQFVCSPVPSLFTTLLSLYISHLTLCSFALGTPYNTCTEGMFWSVIGTKILGLLLHAIADFTPSYGFLGP